MSVVDLPYPFDGEENLPPFVAARINAYRRAGWKALIPLPYGKQDPPPSGFTGRAGRRPNNAQYKEWIDKARSARNGTMNIAVVHGPETIAIDVDHYHYVDKKTGAVKEKRGGDALAALEEELGALPTTWRSSARGADNPSGQRFFRLRPEHSPEVLAYDDKPGPSIEIVRFGHRYSVVWPSMNGRLGEVYEWYILGINGTDVLATTEEIGSDGIRRSIPCVPNVDDLPYLSDKWVEYLTRGFTKYKDEPRVSLDDSATADWVASRPGSTDEPCAVMQKALDKAIEEMPDGAHDTARDKLMSMMWLAHEGHMGLHTASMRLRDAFFEEVNGRRSPGAARAEWYREYVGAVARVAAREGAVAAGCACWTFSADGDEGNGAAKDPATYEQNDGGNAEHLLDLVEGDMIWCKGYNSWMLWDLEEAVWLPDSRNESIAHARRLEPRLKESARKHFDSAAAMSDEDPQKKRMAGKAVELKDWARQCGNRVRLTAMLDVAKAFPNVTVPMLSFDANPSILTCKGGTIELLGRGNEEAIRFRESKRSDYSMHTTGIEYVPWSNIRRGGNGAGLLEGRGLWENYLDTFIPDTELRWYVQRLLGYSIFGANPDRKIVFFQGITSTGKSTILEAASAALGRYASSFNLSMFRENQDERPRPDLVDALTRRLIVATEGDSEWHLHADTIKRSVGGVDKIRARNLHSNDILERAPAFLPIVGTNSAPTIAGADAALWRRLVAVPFDIQISPGRDKSGASGDLTRRLDCRMSVLSWMVDGYIGYCRQGIDDLPAQVSERSSEFRQGVSDWHSFMSETIEPAKIGVNTSPKNDSGGQRGEPRILVQDLYVRYRMWCALMDISEKQMLSKRQFDAKLLPNGYKVERRKRENSQSKANYLLGWRLKEDQDEKTSMQEMTTWMNKHKVSDAGEDGGD